MTRTRVLAMISSMRGGGSEKQTLMLLQHLDRDRFEPHLFLLEKTGAFLDQVPDDVKIHDGALIGPAPRIYIPGGLMRRQASRLREICQFHKIDVIYDRTFRMTLLASVAVDSLGLPRVSTIVSPPHRAVPLVEQRWITIKRKRLAAAYRSSRHVIAVSEQARQSAIEYYGLPKDRIECLPNPVDPLALQVAAGRERVDPKPDPPGADQDQFNQDRSRSKKNGNEYGIVVVGRMSIEKGHADLIHAIERLDAVWPTDRPSLAIRMIGDGPLRGSLEEFARGLKRHRVEFLGSVASPAREIAQADALILPSHFEGMPNVVLEAMALGTDVIATRSGGTIELEREEPTTWWAEPKHPESLASAIELWAASPDEAARRNRAAKRMVSEHHDVVKTTRKVECCLA